MTSDDKIRDKKNLQFHIDREAATTTALSLKNVININILQVKKKKKKIKEKKKIGCSKIESKTKN